MAHGLTVPPKHLMHPPEPLSRPQVQDAIQTTTPPPSPKRQETDDTVDYPHWGLLKPLNVDAPFTDWFFSRQKTVYKIGASKTEMDIVIVEPVMNLHQCTIEWDGTDDPGAVRITDFSDPPMTTHITGTFINKQRLEKGVPYVLHHGDELQIYPTSVVAADEDLNFVWLQCTRQGWLDLEYEQYSGPSRPILSWADWPL